MSNRLLEQLEKRIDNAIETMEILRLQVEELETKNTSLENENSTLKTRQTQWEQGLNTLLSKLDDDPSIGKSVTDTLEAFEKEEIEALV